MDIIVYKQIPLTADTIKKAISAIYNPDMVEAIFTDSNNPTQRQSFAYAKKENGYYVVVEAVGGKTNPNIVPVMILNFTEERWNEFINSGKSIGDILYEKDPQKLSAINSEENKKSRVFVAKFQPKLNGSTSTYSTFSSTRDAQKVISNLENTISDSKSQETQEKFSDRDKVAMAETAEKHFGTTNNFKEMGYITINGKGLDFSGRHWGSKNINSREVDHADVSEILPDDFDTYAEKLAYNTIPKTISVGAYVNKGDTLGIMGATGRATGSHIHFQVYDIDSEIIEPSQFLKGRDINEGAEGMFIKVETCKYTDKGEKVKNLQKKLCQLSPELETEVRNHSFVNGDFDGVFGKGLMQTLISIQAVAGLEQTGKCDKETADLLNGDLIEVTGKINAIKETLKWG